MQKAEKSEKSRLNNAKMHRKFAVKGRLRKGKKCRIYRGCGRAAAQNGGAWQGIGSWIRSGVKKITKVPLMIAKIEFSGTAKTETAICLCMADCCFYCLQVFL